MGMLYIKHKEDDTINEMTKQPLTAEDARERLRSMYGGDPDNVTIWGESAGGGSCTMLPLIKGSHAYFKRVIAESGSVNQMRSPEEGAECTNELMEKLGCKTVADLLKVDGKNSWKPPPYCLHVNFQKEMANISRQSLLRLMKTVQQRT